MKSITIHNLDDQLAARIQQRARKEGTSMNKLIKRLLAQAFGLAPEPQGDREAAFRDLFGVWDESDLRAFEEEVKDFETIDQQDWE